MRAVLEDSGGGRRRSRVSRALASRCGSGQAVRCSPRRRRVASCCRNWLWGPLSPLGLGIAALTVLADQAHKAWMLYVYDIGAKGPVALTSFFDLVLVWNQGISYGLLPQESVAGRWGLILFAFGRKPRPCRLARASRLAACGRLDRPHHRRRHRQRHRPHRLWRGRRFLLAPRLRLPMVRVQYRRYRHCCRGGGTSI